MSNIIHTPSVVSVDDHSSTSATFGVEPLHSGYGMTLATPYVEFYYQASPALQLPVSRSKV